MADSEETELLSILNRALEIYVDMRINPFTPLIQHRRVILQLITQPYGQVLYLEYKGKPVYVRVEIEP